MLLSLSRVTSFNLSFQLFIAFQILTFQTLALQISKTKTILKTYFKN